MNVIWSLPGPNQLLGQVADAIRVGRHVVLDWPVYAPPLSSFQRALYDRLATEEIHLQRLSPGDHEDAKRWLAERYDLDPTHSVTAANLIDHTDWRGTVNWLELYAQYGIWLKFLQEVSSHTNNQVIYERSLLIMAVPPPIVLPVPDAGIAVFSWDDYYDDTDALMLAHSRLRQRFHGVTRSLLATSAAQVALFDVPLLLDLLVEDKETMLEPSAFLRREEVRREWDARTERSRELGSAVVFAGNERVHSCIKVQDGGIDRRLWRSQVNVLLPFLEEERQNYIRKYERYLRIPFETDFGVIRDCSDLELSHLSYQAEHYFRNQAWLDLPRLQRLKESRHALAHLKTIPLQNVLGLLDC